MHGVYSFVNPRLVRPDHVTFFQGKALVNKLWLLLYKRAKLDLRLTMYSKICHNKIEFISNTF